MTRLGLLCVLVCSLRLNATTIVVIHTGTGFVVAADSKLSDNHGNPLATAACKVFESRENALVWGFAGLVESETFRPVQIIRPLVTGSNPRVISERIQSAIVSVLAEEAKKLRINAPDKFALLIGGNDIFGVFVVTRNHAILQGYSVAVNTDQDVIVKPSGGPMTCDEGCGVGKIMRLGQYAEIDQFVRTHPNKINELGTYVDFAEFLVDLEIKALPKLVGPPIDVVELNGEGVHWVKRKCKCVEP